MQDKDYELNDLNRCDMWEKWKKENVNICEHNLEMLNGSYHFNVEYESNRGIDFIINDKSHIISIHAMPWHKARTHFTRWKFTLHYNFQNHILYIWVHPPLSRGKKNYYHTKTYFLLLTKNTQLTFSVR